MKKIYIMWMLITYDGRKCNSNQKSNNEKCWCNCNDLRKNRVCEKDNIWNPSTCTSKNTLQSVISGLLITCDEIRGDKKCCNKF